MVVGGGGRSELEWEWEWELKGGGAAAAEATSSFLSLPPSLLSLSPGIPRTPSGLRLPFTLELELELEPLWAPSFWKLAGEQACVE